jgi:hypothetical protein
MTHTSWSLVTSYFEHTTTSVPAGYSTVPSVALLVSVAPEMRRNLAPVVPLMSWTSL